MTVSVKKRRLGIPGLALLSLFCLLPLVSARDFPGQVTNAGHQFSLASVNDFNSEEDGWYKADWSFDENACEFNPRAVNLKKGFLNLNLLKKKKSDMGQARDKPYWGGEYCNDTVKDLYGRFVVRMKPVSLPGCVSSFFLYFEKTKGDGSYEDTSEVDIEFAGTSREVQYNIIWVDSGNGSSKQGGVETLFDNVVQIPKAYDLPFDAAKDFHEWTIEWTPEHIAFYLDGKLHHEYTDPQMIQEFVYPMGIHMNLWVSESVEWVGKFDPRKLPLSAVYDYVAYYKMTK